MLSEKQLNDLYESLSMEERVGELLQLSGDNFGADGEITGQSTGWVFTADDVYHCGSILNTYGVKQLRAIQEEHLKHDRVPMIFMGDVVSGYSASLPVPLAQACSFNPDLVKELCESAAEAVSADGVSVTFSPMVDICRDARWGRVCEGYGEDTYLTSVMAKAAVTGYQGDNSESEKTVSSCVKHFAAYGYPESGRDYNNVELSERTLKETYLPAYKAAVDAGCDLVMTSFNCIGGVPATINKHLLKDTLRDEWGFKGTIITDWASMLRCKRLRAANSDKEIARIGAESTVDIDMIDYLFTKYWPEMIKNGELDEQLFKESVLRVLRLKNKQGILENPYKYLSGRTIDFKKHYDLAVKAVTQSCVLLKNEDSVLPLDKNSHIALIGPYTQKQRAITMWSKRHRPETDELIKMPETAFNDLLKNPVICEAGCPILEADNFMAEEDLESDNCYKDLNGYFNRAIEAAKKCDSVVLMLGEHFYQGGESASRSEINIPEIQLNLLREISKVNKNIVTVVFSVRPLDLREVSKLSKAVLFAWMPGDGGNEGIAKLILGDAVPSGRLAMSMPYCVGQVPLHYDLYQDGTDINSSKQRFTSRYVDAPNKPLYSFGYGLSYSEFSYSPVTLSCDTLTENGSIKASVTVTNNGKFDAYEVVQLYIQDLAAVLVSRPFRELKGFKRTFIKKGESVTVDFEINADMLKFFNSECEYVNESGQYKLFIGKDSNTENSKDFVLE